MALQNTTNKIACHPLPKGEYLGVGEQEESKANFAKRVREKVVPVWLRGQHAAISFRRLCGLSCTTSPLRVHDVVYVKCTQPLR